MGGWGADVLTNPPSRVLELWLDPAATPWGEKTARQHRKQRHTTSLYELHVYELHDTMTETAQI